MPLHPARSLQRATSATRWAYVPASPSQDCGQVEKSSRLIAVQACAWVVPSRASAARTRHGADRTVDVAPPPQAVVLVPSVRLARALRAGRSSLCVTFPRTLRWRNLVVRTAGRTLCALGAATLIVASACSDPQSPKLDAAILPQPGYPLAVTVTTAGFDIDPDGYTVWVDDSQRQPVGANGVVTFTVPAGPHEVVLYGVASNCTVSGANPQSVTVQSGATAAVPFSVSCAPTQSGTGRLTVKTSTTGSNLDPDGYTVTIDGTVSQPIATNGSVTVTVPTGANPVPLSGVAANCTVSGANPRTVSVAAGGTGTTTFSVTCSAQLPPPEVTGQGQLGMGPATPGNEVQTFAFDVRADLTGRFTATDYNDIHPSGNPASILTDPATDPATSITRS